MGGGGSELLASGLTWPECHAGTRGGQLLVEPSDEAYVSQFGYDIFRREIPRTAPLIRAEPRALGPRADRLDLGGADLAGRSRVRLVAS